MRECSPKPLEPPVGPLRHGRSMRAPAAASGSGWYRQRHSHTLLGAVCYVAMPVSAVGLNVAANLAVDTVKGSDPGVCPKQRISVVAEPPLQEGLFGMVLERVLQLLPAAAKASPDRETRFEPRSPCYGDALASLFVDRLSKVNATCPGVPEEQITFEEAWRRGWATKAEDLHSFRSAGALWNSRFSLAPGLQEELDAAAARLPTDGVVLGVHFRGTDKYLEARPVAPADMWTLVEDFVTRSADDVAAIFVATDGEEFAKLAEKRVAGGLRSRHGRPVKLVMNPSARSQSDQPLHKQGSCPPGLAKEALLDALMLSRCDVVLKTASQLSAWSKVFNPSLQMFRVNAFYPHWFPDADVPLYEPRGAPPAVDALLAQLRDGEGSASAAQSPWGAVASGIPTGFLAR